MEPLDPGEVVLSFDLSGDFGHFKRYYTNMSPLTFPVPPPTTLRGMLGAILGIDKHRSPEHFAHVAFAVQLNRPVKTTVIPTNYVKTASRSNFARFQSGKPTTVEWLKDPSYRIFVACRDAQMSNALEDMLANHRSVYTLSLGNAQSLANYTYRGRHQVHRQASGAATINGLVPTDDIQDIQFDDLELFTLTLPVRMKNDRTPLQYREYLYERRGQPIRAEFSQYVTLDNGEPLVFI